MLAGQREALNSEDSTQAQTSTDLAQAIHALAGAEPWRSAYFELGPGVAYVIELPSRRLRFVGPLDEEFPRAFRNVVVAAGSWDDLVAPDDRAVYAASWAGFEEAGAATVHSYRARASRRGGSIPVKDYRLPLRDAAGAVVGALGRLVDDSFRSAAMESLARRSWKEIAAAMTRRFLHDFNNTIAGIYSLSELYAEPGSDPKSMAEAMRYIRDNSVRAQALTSQIRQLTTLEPGEASLHDLEKLAKEQDEYIKALLPKGATVRYVLSGEETPVRLDANSFRQAILHLACNARDAIPGEAIVTIRCEQLRSREGKVVGRLAFCDNGHGFKDGALGQALDPFFTTKEANAGLGLNIVKDFLESLGGALSIASEPGQGATITLDFPVADLGQARAPRQPAPEAAPAPVARAPIAAPERPEPLAEILVYTWEDIARHPLVRALTESGWPYRVHYDASEALLAASSAAKTLRGILVFKSALDERVGPLLSELARAPGAPPIALIALGESVDGLSETVKKGCGLIASGAQRPAVLMDRLAQLFR